MSDEQKDDARRATSAKAAAASRARRIGGRTATTPTASTPATTAPTSTKTTSLVKEPAERTEPKPASSKKKAKTPAKPEAAGRETEAKARTATATKTRPAVSARVAPSTGNGWLIWLPAALLSVAALVFAVLIAVDAGDSKSSPSASKATAKLREQVLAATKQCVAQANTYDYRTIAASEAKAQACTTGKYKTDNKNTFEKVIKPKAALVHATQSFQTDVAGVENVSEDGKTWKILLFGQNHSINDSTGSEGRYDPVAIDVTMTKVGSKWLISELIPV